MTVNEYDYVIKKLKEVIILQSRKHFAIYPYGLLGREVKKILNNEFGVQEECIVDNYVVGDNIVRLCDLPKNDINILICNAKEDSYQEIRKNVFEIFESNKIIDLFPQYTIKLFGMGSGMYSIHQQVIDTIKKVIADHRTEIAIYPYGRCGKFVKNILNNDLKIQESYIVDDKKFYLEDLRNVCSENVLILLCSNYLGNYDCIRKNIAKYFDEKNIVDIFQKKTSGETVRLDIIDETIKKIDQYLEFV